MTSSSASTTQRAAQPPVDARASRAQRAEAVLACPECHGPLDAGLRCEVCDRVVGTRHGEQFRFGGFGESEFKQDPLNRIKEWVKQRLSWLYPLSISVLSPVLTTRFVKPFLASFDLDHEVVADMGSGTHRREPRLLTADGGTYPEVDIVTDLQRLPVADGSLSGVMSIAVLEHVPNPAAHIEEFRRVLRPGGRVLCFVPFMQPFHASPYDFQRFTNVGLREQFSGFEVLSVRVGAGPTSGMLWVLQEWLAILLSFGSAKLYRLLAPLFWILSPLKFLDLLLAYHPNASVIASGFVVEARRVAD